VGIGFGLYAADSHSILGDYFPLAALQNFLINFGLQHIADLHWLLKNINLSSFYRLKLKLPC